MYAVIKTGGKQYKVKAGDTVKIEKLEAVAGKTVKLTDILMLVDGDKVNIVKFQRRKHHRKQMGHRQAYTELSIMDINTK